jgi:hypothetical protein
MNGSTKKLLVSGVFGRVACATRPNTPDKLLVHLNEQKPFTRLKIRVK